MEETWTPPITTAATPATTRLISVRVLILHAASRHPHTDRTRSGPRRSFTSWANAETPPESSLGSMYPGPFGSVRFRASQDSAGEWRNLTLAEEMDWRNFTARRPFGPLEVDVWLSPRWSPWGREQARSERAHAVLLVHDLVKRGAAVEDSDGSRTVNREDGVFTPSRSVASRRDTC